MNEKLYDKFSGDDLIIAQRIQKLRLCILVHSRIYYVLDENIITDTQWSKWGTELAELQNKYPEIAEQVIWHEAFIDWDGSSGAFLPLDDEWVVKKANELLERHGKSKKPAGHVDYAMQVISKTTKKPVNSAKKSLF